MGGQNVTSKSLEHLVKRPNCRITDIFGWRSVDIRCHNGTVPSCPH
jgi:hypothetical protein